MVQLFSESDNVTKNDAKLISRIFFVSSCIFLIQFKV